jgi:hypothetical protein
MPWRASVRQGILPHSMRLFRFQNDYNHGEDSTVLFGVAAWFAVIVLAIFFCLGLLSKFLAYCKAGG